MYKYNKATNENIWVKALTIPKPSFKIEVRNSTLRRLGIPYYSKTVLGGSQKPSSNGGGFFAPGTSEASALTSNFALDSTTLCFITGLPAYYLVCMDKQTGDFLATTFQNVNAGTTIIGAPVIKDNLIYYALPTQKKFYVANKSGTILNSYDLNGEVYASIVAANAKLFVATNKGGLYTFETSANHAPQKPLITSPANLANITTENVTLSWVATDQDGDPLNYSLKVTNGNNVQIFNNLTDTSFTLENLALNTQYTVEVRAFETNSKKAYSVWSDKVTFTYKKFQGIPPQPPSNLRVISTAISGGHNFLVSWEPSPSAGVRGYRISYKKSDGSFSTQLEIPNTSFVFTTACSDTTQFDCLENNKNYQIQVKAINIEALESDAITKNFFSGAPFLINDIPQPYNNLEDVINTANINDTIKILPTTLVITSPIVITKPLKIEGESSLDTALIFDGFEKGIVVQNILSKSNFKPDVLVEISKIAVIGAVVGVEINAPTRVKNCVIAKGGTGIVANSDSEIINNTIVLNNANGISINSGNHLIKNNIIGENAGVGISLSGGNINILKY
ncbi:MAG: fibronectin type III domain-containing protein, partial [Planctomycetota bacterium]